MNITTKLSVLLTGCALALLAAGTGCEKPLTDTQTTISPNSDQVRHIVMREVNPDDFSEDNIGNSYNIYFTDTASRTVISETIPVEGLTEDTTTMYIFSNQTTKEEYIFNYPNIITATDVEVTPDNHPFKALEQGGPVITSLPIDKSLSGNSDTSFTELILEPVLTWPEDQLQIEATKPYIITDAYFLGPGYVNDLERRVTIDPKTNLPTKIQLVDITNNKTIKTLIIDTYKIEDQSTYDADFFTANNWKESLPGENHLIIEAGDFELITSLKADFSWIPSN